MSSPQPTVTLGVYVGPDTLDAVLVRRTADRFEPIQRFTRPRVRESEFSTPEQMAAALPGLSSGDDDDYTLQVGGDWGSGGPAARPTPGAQGDGAASPSAASGRPFAPALKDILAECAAAGYPELTVTFCLTAPEVSYVEVLAAGADPEKGAKKPSDKKRIEERVRERAPAADPARTAVVPLGGDGPDRVLAVAVDAGDPVSLTLQLLTDEGSAPAMARLDAEATLIAAMMNRAHASEGERTVVVRVGNEDTLVLFFEGAALASVERLRSLSAYDLPETVVSRVLLQQDARKAGDPDTVYVASTGRTDLLLGRFAEFFPEAAVEPLDAAVAGLGIEVPRDEGAYRAGPLLAAVAAARELSDWEVTPDVHLLPTKLRRRKSRRLDWPTLAAAALVALVFAVGVVRYLSARSEIVALEDDLRENPPVLPDEDPEQLQARVDSLNQTFAMYTRSLDVLDSLLIGSDQWTQSMRLVTRTTEASGGTWLTNWAPDGGSLRLSGQSLSRTQIVSLSRRLEGIIEMIEYTDVGPTRVFSFDMLMPVPVDIPEIAQYLRNNALARASGDSTMIAMEADSTAFVVDPVGHTH